MRWLRPEGMRPVHLSILNAHPKRWPKDKGGEYDDTGPKAAYIRISPDQSGESMRLVAVHEVRHHVLSEWTKQWNIHLTDKQEHDLIEKLEAGDVALRGECPALWP